MLRVPEVRPENPYDDGNDPGVLIADGTHRRFMISERMLSDHEDRYTEWWTEAHVEDMRQNRMLDITDIRDLPGADKFRD